MYVIGLTGGVGSGKTAAAHMLAELAGAELLLADDLGHLAMEKGTEGCRQIVECFGSAILEEQGIICRSKLAEIVFQDAEKLALLNRIVHPVVKEYLKNYIAERRESKGYLVLESAIMFETGCDVFCDEIWYISAPEQIRKMRLRQSRGYSEEKIEQIMRRQLKEEEFLTRCKQVVNNDGDMASLKNKLKDSFILVPHYMP